MVIDPTAGRWSPPDLGGRIAVVTGATRGVGRGIAEVLGQCGATVYLTGRSTRAAPTQGEPAWSIEVAAEAVTTFGGRGIPVRCDHGEDAQVEALFERVRGDQGRLDILVSNATGSDYFGQKTVDAMYAPIWAKPIGWWDANMGVGVRSSFVACRFGLPLMVGHPGLVVLTTQPPSKEPIHPDPIYDLRAQATVRMAASFARQLSPEQVTILAVVPGDVQTHSRRQGHEHEPLPEGAESIYLTGRAVASLAGDVNVASRAGSVVRVAECAQFYGFSDVNGALPA